MADLRLVVLGCLMLVVFSEGGIVGDVLSNCLFTPNCPISSFDDVRKGLAQDLRKIDRWQSGALGAMVECARTIEMTGTGGNYASGVAGCCDDSMVERTGCKKACDVVKRLLMSGSRGKIKC